MIKEILKAYKYRLYPNTFQKNQLSKTFGCCRFIYNYYLAKRIELYELEHKSFPKYDCNNHCNQFLKKEFIWLKEVDKFALTNSIYNLDNAYQNFFKKVKQGDNELGFPKFKSKHNHHYSYTTNYTNNNIRINYKNNKIKLPKLKWVDCKLHRQFNGKIKSATISQVPSGKYYVSVLIEEEILELPKDNNIIAFDLGIKEFLIDSNNNHINNPKILYRHENQLAKLQRQLKHKKLGSKNRNKTRIKVAKLYEKITNIRKDFLNKLSSKIINENQIIISEDLKIAKMIINNKLSKAIFDVSWYEFTRQLTYKSKWYGRIYHKIDPWFASSQICSVCGYKNKKVKNLSIRQWECNCGVIHNRDENASQNILKQGKLELGLI